MKITGIQVTDSLDGVRFSLLLPPESSMEAHWAMQDLRGANEVEVIRKRKKRSGDQNAYMWELVGKIAEKLRSSQNEVYRGLIRDYGVYEVIPVREDHIDHWVEIWAQRGIGWVCDDLGECRNHTGYHNIRTFYGSSSYNTKEMARLIDGVIQECRQLGIETLSDDEIRRLYER